MKVVLPLRTEVTVSADFVANLPKLDAHRSVAIDGQKVVLRVVKAQRRSPGLILSGRRAAEAGPKAGRAPVIPLGVDTDFDVAGGTEDAGRRIRIGHPSGRFFRLAAHRVLMAGAVVDGDHPRGAGLIENTNEVAEVRGVRSVASRRTIVNGPLINIGVATTGIAEHLHAAIGDGARQRRLAEIVRVDRRVQGDTTVWHKSFQVVGVDMEANVDLSVGPRRNERHDGKDREPRERPARSMRQFKLHPALCADRIISPAPHPAHPPPIRESRRQNVDAPPRAPIPRR